MWVVTTTTFDREPNVVELATEIVLSEIFKTGIERNIQMEDLIKDIDQTRPSTIEWLRTIRNYVKYSNQSGLYRDVEIYLKSIKGLL